MVQFTITVDGTVKDVSVIASGNLPAVDEAAIRCVSKWHYVPAAKDGTPIEQPGWQARVLWKALN
jgi:TonB family protein